MKAQNNDISIYIIEKEYIPILIKRSLFKNHDLAVKSIDKNYLLPLYVFDDVSINSKKKSNAFLIFRIENFQNVKMKNANSSSREISKIIGKMWKQMSNESKLPYQVKANNMKSNDNSILRYNKLFSNLKRRDYKKQKELISDIKALLLSD